jgi:hypothetical protein
MNEEKAIFPHHNPERNDSKWKEKDDNEVKTINKNSTRRQKDDK